MSEYMKNFECVKEYVRSQWGNLPENVIFFIAMLDDAKMGHPYSGDRVIEYDVLVFEVEKEVNVKNETDKMTYVFDLYTGQLLYCSNYQQ